MNTRYQKRVFREAVEWFVQLQSECCDEQQRQRFLGWITESDAHKQAYSEAERLWSNLDNLKKTDLRGLDDARSAGPPRRGISVQNSMSALLLAALVGGWWQDYHAEPLSYSTGVGERQSISLADGSHLELNAVTRLSVRLSWIRRRVELEEGEVLFKVAHQGLRPFTVQMNDLQIKDIGTVFNIRQRPEGGVISVLEGEVELRSGDNGYGDSLKAGFRRRVDKDGRLQPTEKVDIEQSAGWTEGHLIFDRTPLADVAAELERHHAVHFVFADPALARLTLSGRFDAADLKPFLVAVEKILPIRTKRQKQAIVLSKR